MPQYSTRHPRWEGWLRLRVRISIFSLLISPATSRFEVPKVPAQTLVVEGEQDDVVPLDSVLEWARPQGLPVTVVPGTGHFYHGQLGLLRDIVQRHLRAFA